MRALLLSALAFSFLPAVYSVACPSGFSVLNNNKCVKIFRNALKHQEAENDCRYYGGTLVNIKNSIDNRAVSSMAGMAGVNTLWIGTFCYANQNETTCYYDDNSGDVQYSNFPKGFPLVDGPYGGCVYLNTNSPNSGQWMSAKCEVIGMPFMCEVPLTYYDNTYCAHNYNGYCYYPSHEMPSNFTRNDTEFNAYWTCSRNFNAYPLSIHSMREVDYVKTLFQHSSISQISLGASAQLPDTFRWDDGSDWDYSFMNPLGSDGTGRCLQMDVKGTGMWTETDCFNRNFFVCKRKTSNYGATPIAGKKTVADTNDFSHCNTTLYMTPGVITSWDFPNHNSQKTLCTWRVATLGPYRLAIYFTTGHTYNGVVVNDEYGNNLWTGPVADAPVTVLAPTNLATVSFQSSGYGVDKGFSATILPI